MDRQPREKESEWTFLVMLSRVTFFSFFLCRYLCLCMNEEDELWKTRESVIRMWGYEKEEKAFGTAIWEMSHYLATSSFQAFLDRDCHSRVHLDWLSGPFFHSLLLFYLSLLCSGKPSLSCVCLFLRYLNWAKMGSERAEGEEEEEDR